MLKKTLFVAEPLEETDPHVSLVRVTRI